MKYFTLVFILISPFFFVRCGDDSESTRNTFVDSRDQHEYQYVTIGTQTWMAENLAYLPKVHRPATGSVTDTLYYVYAYDEEDGTVQGAKDIANYSYYGVLYNWEAARISCPAGWHLPSDQEWKTLEKYLGMSQEDADANTIWRKSGYVARALKSSSGWSFSGNGTNSSGFNAVPGGQRDNDDGFNTVRLNAWFWTATATGTTNAWFRDIYCTYDGIWRATISRRQGFSVRCIKD